MLEGTISSEDKTHLIPVFDNGHAGLVNGKYETPGKRSPNLGKGVLFEGAFNRWFINRLMEKCDRAGIPYYNVSPEHYDVPLKVRTDRANEIWKKNKQTYGLSIHANAGGGKGPEGFTSKGVTKSDAIADEFLKDVEESGIYENLRFDYSDGDRDKESNFYILRNTKMPFFLFEVGFMDNQVDYDKLMSVEFLEKAVEVAFCSVERLYRNGI